MKQLQIISIASIFAASIYTSSVFAGDDDRNHYRGGHDKHQKYKHRYKKENKRHRRQHHRDNHYRNDHAYGHVIRVKPIYESVRVYRPGQQCWQEPVRLQRRHRVNYGTADHIVAGSLIGGAIGNHLGNDHNRQVTTLAGSIIGAVIAQDVAGGHRYVQNNYDEERVVYQKQCRQTGHYETEQQVMGYRVKYRHNGHVYKTRVRHHPGKRIKIY